jgi:hypothetical protein
MDNNIYYPDGPYFRYGLEVLTFSEWQAKGVDTNSKIVDPNLDADLRPQDSSVDVINKGINLGSQCVECDDGLNPSSIWPDSVLTLDQDNYGSGWEIGAFVYEEQSTCSPADTNTDGVVSITELMSYIGQWKAGNVLITELMTAIGEWKNGC